MRKKWTPKTEITDSLLDFREKRKWQIALRRYILGKNKSSQYAPYFGLDSLHFRKWIEIQFDSDMSWDNFSSVWQFDHVLPITYFNFRDPQELRLCWNFINICVEKTIPGAKKLERINILASKSYFQTIYHNTAYSICLEFIKKINGLQVISNQTKEQQIKFFSENKDLIQVISNFSSEDFDKLNAGIPIAEILAEKELIRKFGVNAD
jgi:hypothetical protein